MSSPAHPKAQSYLNSGIFDRLENFRQFEGSIAALPTPQERGAVFEVFVEAYLATLAVQKAKQVWPGACVPSSLRKRLALTLNDKGVDGVFETQLGEYHAYQAKFRTGRPSLTWDELSTFIGLADRVDRRVLVTNCDRFADVVKQRADFYAITGTDFDKLSAQDFAAIRAWLEGVKAELPRRKYPHSYQNEAVTDILSALREGNRATALMACGTGKTMVALWAAERLDARSILVLVPSLALLRQLLHEWARETSWPRFAHLCVCSDSTVKPISDELFLRVTDLDFSVTTDPGQVRNFLAAKFEGVKVVFATYQSAHVVADGMQADDAFDIAIFDEAHKTAGREGGHFGFALKDENLSVKKRLFLTATPRHCDMRKRDKEGDAMPIYSMDNLEVYGPVAHKLSFAEAARRDIICGYKVIISVVTSDMVNDHQLRHGEVIVKGDSIPAHRVACQLALQDAVKQHGIRKIFTFHRSVASAAAFTSDGPQGIGNHLSSFDAFHINGSMPTSERENIMTEFRAASRAVISNAKCLTEGVDVPAVDMVAFLTPKRSRVDIVQATGRAMRKAPGKTTGYILVPLFVEQAKGETIEKALTRTEFDEVWKVLQAMQEQDDVLAESIRQIQEERGRGAGIDDSRFRERVEILGPSIDLEVIRSSITTLCAEYLSASFDFMLGKLKAYKHHFDDCNVPNDWSEDQKLGVWVKDQRMFFKNGALSATRIRKLEEMGFAWGGRRELVNAKWLKNYRKIVGWMQESEIAAIGNLTPQSSEPLQRWLRKQRVSKRTGQLTEEQIRLLDEIKYEWQGATERGGRKSNSGRRDDLWEQRFAELVKFKAGHGHCRVDVRTPSLGPWVNRQRTRNQKRTLDPERKRRLDGIDFAWKASKWD